MDKSHIAEKATKLSSKEELLALLNELKQDDLGDKACLFRIKQLNYFCNPNHFRSRYVRFDIPKKSGKESRHITAPIRGLKSLLVYVNKILQAMYEADDCVMGFVPGRSVVTNAACHTGQNYVFNIDLKDFFTSIEQARVWKRLQLPPFNFRQEIANILAGLCCMKEQDGNKFKYVLPQGAPTSPIITNMVCGTLDRRLKGLAKRFGVKYTRYADDMTFSSMHHVYQEDGEFRKELRRIIAGQNFTLNEAKTRLQKRGARQEVTGLTVCTKVNVTRKYIREIRSILYMWERYGYSVAYNKFYLFYKADKGYFKKGDPVPENVLSGKLLYLKMVKGEKDSTYLALQERFDKLCGIWVENGDSNNNDLTCLASYSITDFETMFRTEIMFEETGNHKYITKCIIDNQEKIILLGRQVASLLKNNLSGDNNGKLLSPTIKNDWFISLCQSENKRFWLIRKEKPKEVNRKPNDLSIDTLLNTWEKQGLEAAIEVFDKTNQPLPDNPATGTDKVTFISIISKHPFLSEKDKERVILLLAKELEKGEVIARGKGEEAKSSRHNPYKVVNFLTKFTRKDCNLKYTTHSWDPNPDDKRFEFTGYDDFIEKYQSEVENLYSYNLPLYYLTQNFLKPSKGKEGTIYSWGKYHLKIGYCFPEGFMRKWMNDNPGKQPSSMPLSCFPDEYIPNTRINGKTLVYFGDIIEIFKRAIEFRDNDLFYLVRSIFRTSDTHLDSKKLDTLKGKCFYTDTYQVEQALEIIAGNIRMRPAFPEVKISAEEQVIENKRFIVLNILHVDSYSDKSIDDDKLSLRNNKGQMKDIKEKLRSLCDFSVISRFQKNGKRGYFRIDYLYDKNANKEPRKNPLSEGEAKDCKGFKYVLKFLAI